MLDFIFIAIFTALIMFLGLFIGFISEWDWFMFFTIIMIIGRIVVVTYHFLFCNMMKIIIDKIKKINKNLLSQEGFAMLEAAPCIFLQPIISPYKITFFNPYLLSMNLQIMAIIIGFMSLYSQKYYIAIISLLIILTGPKLWQPNPFFTNDEKVNFMNILGLYLKTQKKSLKYIMPAEVEYISVLYIQTKDFINYFIDGLIDENEEKYRT